MTHLSEERLIEHYYGEGEPGERATTEQHLAECAECAKAFEALRRELEAVSVEEPSPVPEGYAASVWQRLEPQLVTYRPQRSAWFAWGAAACAAMLVLAFVGGRLWEQQHPRSIARQRIAQSTTSVESTLNASTENASEVAGDDAPVRQPATANSTRRAASPAPKVRERVVLLVVGDHLERSERLLVALRHAADQNPDQLRSDARELLGPNRLYRTTAAEAGDVQLNTALTRLERLLIELANSPEGTTAAQLEHLEQQMNHDGVLFEIRVLRTRAAEPVHQRTTSATKGAQI